MGRRLALLIAAASLLAGCSGAGGQAPDAQIAAESVAQSMLLAGPPALAMNASAPDLRKLRRQLKEYLSEQDGTYGVYVVDLITGRGVGINSDQVFPAASTFKLPMALYILDLAAEGKASLDEQIAYAPSDWEEGTGTLQEWIRVGDRLKVRELVELAITQSDNIATQMLLRRFGVQHVYDYMHQLGGRVTHYADGVPGTTPREMADYMRHAQANLIRDPGLKRFLLAALENTAFADRTAAGVPQGVTVAHKIGTLPNVVNDVALVLAPGRPFIIAAFSVGVDEEVAPFVITEVTRRVYDFLISG